MSQSPVTAEGSEDHDEYLAAFNELAQRIRDGASFSGRERHCAFLNTRNGTFADISAISGFGMPDDGRGMALVDWDHDGDLDIWLSNRTAPRLQFLQNRIPGPETRWVALRLEGSPALNCARDAIGSQVELVLSGDRGRRVKSLRAGDGLMSQSSKWMHFGLGADGEIAEVRVRWAGGETESFAGVSPGRRWLLKQGAGSAMPIEPRRPLALDPTPLPLPEPTEVARVRLSQPLKAPELAYRDLAGKEQRVGALADRQAVLVNLWATWCAPCVAELKAFAAAKDRLEREGLTVLALNVDHLAPGNDTTPGQAAAALRRLGYDLPAGIADPDLVDLLGQSILRTVYLHRDMPVPVSFLIDRGGWLSAIYKGPVELDQLLADRRELGKGFEAARAAAVPFPGLWAEHYFLSNPITVAAAYLDGRYLDDARHVLEDFLEKNEDAAAAKSLPPAEQQNRHGQLADVYFHLARVAELELDQAEALRHYQKALAFNPRYLPALNQLAWLLATSSDPAVRNPEQALTHARFMMQAPGAADNPSLLATLAAAQAAAGHFPDAADTTRKILALLDARGIPPTAPDPTTHRHRLHLFETNQPL